MNWMDKLERKWGRHAVANLSRYFVLAQVIGYVVQLTAPGLMSYMNFDMGSILHGQLWRVVTWIFTPTASLDVFGILFLFCVPPIRSRTQEPPIFQDRPAQKLTSILS